MIAQTEIERLEFRTEKQRELGNTVRHDPIESRPIKKLLIVSAVLFAVMVAAGIAMQTAFNAGNRDLVRVFAGVTALSLISSTLCFLVSVARYNEGKARERMPDELRAWRGDGDYVATHCLSNRIVALIFAVASALLTGFFYVHPGYIWTEILCSAMLLFSTATTYLTLSTTVRFTDKTIVVEMKPFTHFSEPYESVTSMRAQPWNLRIQFADGRVLNIAAGLGDSGTIASILAERVDVSPS